MSVGVNVAVIRDDPPPATVVIAPLIVAMDASDDVYDHVPLTDELLYVALGSERTKSASPYVFGSSTRLPSDGVAR